jgi:hypothetical protein
MMFYKILLVVIYCVGIPALFVVALMVSMAIVSFLGLEISRLSTVELPYTFYYGVEYAAEGIEKKVIKQCQSTKSMMRKIYENLGIEILSDNVDKKVFEAKLPRGIYVTTDKFTHLHKLNDDVLLTFWCDRVLCISDIGIVPNEYL